MIKKVITKYFAYFESFQPAQNNSEDSNDLSYWRNFLFLRFLSIIFPLSLIVVIPSFLMCLQGELLILGVIDTSAVLIIAFISFTRLITLQIKKTLFVTAMYFLATSLLFIMGITGPGYLYLLCISVIFSTLISSTSGYISIGINIGLVLTFNILTHYGQLGNVIVADSSIASNMVVGLNFALINTMLIVLINHLLLRLNNTLKKDRFLRKKAQESDSLKSTFLANISHEIRTPLNAIMGFSDLALDDYEGDDEINAYLNHIHKAGDQLLGIIDSLIRISIIESGQIEIIQSEVSLSKLLDECYQTTTTLPRSSKVKIFMQFDKEIICNTDKVQLQQALSNLIVNALKFTEEGEVSIGYTSQKDHVRFFVKDTGSGIPEDVKYDLFKRFYKIKNANAIKAGTGLGLAIAKGIVESLEGKIWYESKLGVGTTFYFTIPLHPIRN